MTDFNGKRRSVFSLIYKIRTGNFTNIFSSHTASYNCMLIKIRFAFTYYPYTSKPFFLNYVYCTYSKFKWTILNGPNFRDNQAS